MIAIEAVPKKLDESIEHFKTELAKIRTGRAQPAMVQHIMVEAYGVVTPLMQVASITVSDAKTLAIQPWDPKNLKDIEKAIRASDLNLSPSVDSSAIRLTMPSLTEENRKALVKIVHERAEDCRVSIRQLREKIKSSMSEESEDVRFRNVKRLDELVKNYSDKINEIVKHKEAEIMTV